MKEKNKIKTVINNTTTDKFNTIYTRAGDLTSLTTTSKDNLVDAINEVNAKPNGKTYTGGNITRNAATQEDEKIIVTDTVITADLLKIPSDAGGIVKSVGNTLDVDTAGKLTNKFIKYDSTENSEVLSINTTDNPDQGGTYIKINQRGDIETGNIGTSPFGLDINYLGTLNPERSTQILLGSAGGGNRTQLPEAPTAPKNFVNKEYSDGYLGGKVLDTVDQDNHVAVYNLAADKWETKPYISGSTGGITDVVIDDNSKAYITSTVANGVATISLDIDAIALYIQTTYKFNTNDPE